MSSPAAPAAGETAAEPLSSLSQIAANRGGVAEAAAAATILGVVGAGWMWGGLRVRG